MKIVVLVLLFTLNLHAKANQRLIDYHESISNTLSKSAETVDQFLSRNEKDNGSNNSNLRVFFLSTIAEEERRLDLLRYRLNLRLPRLEKRFRLSIENQTERRELDKPVVNSKINEEQQKTLEDSRASINYDNDLSNFKQSFGVGLRFALPLISFFTNRLSHTKEYDHHTVRTILDIFGNSKTGLGQTLSVDIDIPMSTKWLFRLVNEQAFIDKDSQFSTSNGPTFFHSVSDNDILSYNFRVNSINEEVFFANEYLFNIVYRRKLYKEFFFFEVTPGRSFAKLNDFEKRDSISFRLELLFQKI